MDDPEQPEWFNKIMRAQQSEKRASGSLDPVVRTRPMMTKDEITSKRQYACDVGHNAGQCIGNMCNYLMDESRTREANKERMEQSLNVAKREIAELETIAREIMDQVSQQCLS